MAKQTAKRARRPNDTPDEAKEILRMLRGGLQPDDSDYFAPAWRFTTRTARAEGATIIWPARGLGSFERRRGEAHYVLRNVSVELARFRITRTGRLVWIETDE